MSSFFLRALLAAVCLSGCNGGPAAPARRPPPAAARSPVATASAASAAPEEVVPAPAPAAADAAPTASIPPDAGSAPVAAPDAGESDIDLHSWLSSRGVPAWDARRELRYIYMSCRPRIVGDHREHALDCQASDFVSRGRGASKVYRTLVRDQILVVRAKRIVVVLDVVVAVVVTDAMDSSAPDIAGLELDVAPDGLSATLGDAEPSPAAGPSPTPCVVALPRVEARAAAAGASAWDRLDLALTRRACAARGKYRWRRGRFVRTNPAPKRAVSAP